MELKARWQRDLAAAGCRGEQEVLADLLARHAEPHRHYHTLQHVKDCLQQLDQHRAWADAPELLALALWFHDAVYNARANDNEAASADLAIRQLKPLGLSPAHLAQVESLILVTRHADDPETRDEQLITDIDLSILGRSPETYDAYAQAIRAEYAWAPAPRYRRGRRQVLEHFLARDALYHLPVFQDTCEAPARANLHRELRHL